MKIINSSRFESMQKQIRDQADRIRKQNVAISLLEQENGKQAERIGELEAVLFCYGITDRNGLLRLGASDRAKIVSEVLERLENEYAEKAAQKAQDAEEVLKIFHKGDKTA